MNIKDYETLLSEMTNYMIANLDLQNITDFNKGSIIRTIFESIARVVESTYIDTRNGYSNNLKAIPYSVFDFKKKEGIKASAIVYFSRSKAINSITVIPAGTRVTAGGLVFSTSASGVISANMTVSEPITVIAEKTGVEYNVAANSIDTIDSVLSSDVVAVNNPLRAVGGMDIETDSQMLARFKSYINGLQGTNLYGLKSAILELEDVRSIAIIEQFPPMQHIYNAIVYVDDGTGQLTSELQEKIETIINGNDTAEYPGCRGAGINMLVYPAQQVSIPVKVTIEVYRTESSKATYEAQEAIVNEINSLSIGESVILSSIILRLRRISYIKDVTYLSLDGSQSNVKLNPEQIARTSTDIIEVTVMDA